MPEIGPTLREARMRAKIDITEVEQATKIRAKYLRAIENEEWGLLPGSTFAKSFIRGYADFLGIDSRSLVEEYKLRYERPSESELRAVSPGLSRDRGRSGRGLSGGRGGGGGGRGGGGGGRGGGRGGGGVPRGVVIVGLLVLVVGALYLLGGALGDSDDGGDAATTGAQAQTTPASARRAQQRRRRAAGGGATTQRQAAVPTVAGLRLIPTGDVYVCLEDGDGQVLIAGEIFRAGQAVPVQRARSMRLTLGNSSVEMRVNGRAIAVPASANAVGFAITPGAARALPVDDLPTCT